MEWLRSVVYIIYLGSWLGCGYGQNVTAGVMNGTQTDSETSTVTADGLNITQGVSVTEGPNVTQGVDVTEGPNVTQGVNVTEGLNVTQGMNGREEFNGTDEFNRTELFNGTTEGYFTEIVTELVTYIEDDFTTEGTPEDSTIGSTPFARTRTKLATAKGVFPSFSPNSPYYTGGDVGLWVAIGVIGLAALIVFITLLATVVLRWKRKDNTSYDVERDENEHTNPAYDAGEIAGLEPTNGMKEVGLTTFAEEDSKAVL